jgi:hypothetical protein
MLKEGCGYGIFGKRFGRLGQNSGIFNGFQYIEGRDGSVVFERVSEPGDS